MIENDKFQITPTPKQIEFITSTAKFSCFAGAFGSGKSYAGCLRGLLLSQYPGNRGLIGRNTYVELRQTTRASFFELCPPEYYDEARGGQWKPSENLLKLTNGSEILFMHLDTISEKELLSLNIGWFFIDQAEEISERVFQVLQSRLRLTTVPNTYGFLACNPEPGSWLYHKFRKPVEDGNPDPNYFLIDSSSYDNPYLPDDYIETLKESYNETLFDKYVMGSWDAVEGKIYSDFSRDMNIVKPFTTPKTWEYILAVDHGMVNPTAALLATIDYDGNVFIIDEYYSPGIVSDHAKAIYEMTGDHEISFWLIDPSTQAKTREKDGMPWSILEEYEDRGLYFTPANNELLGGINRVSEFLRPDEKRIHPIKHTKPAPRLYVFQNCVNLIAEFPGYQWKKLRGFMNRNVREQPVDYNDHALDALRYIIMSRFPPPLRRGVTNLLVPLDQRPNLNNMSQEMPKNYTGDPLLGSFYGQGVDSSLSTENYE